MPLPNKFHTIMPVAYESVTSRGKRDFEHTLRTLRRVQGGTLDYSGRSNLST